jgi:acyl-CoA reductase-like NAD-dependent aldehyde dehydrogenase
MSQTAEPIDWIGRASALRLKVRDFVNGRWLEPQGGGEVIHKQSPRDGTSLCVFEAGGLENVNGAVESARRAFEDGRWSQQSATRRKETLLRLAALVVQHSDELALLECLDVGKPIADALSIDVPAAVSILRFNAEAADKVFSKIYSADQQNLSFQLRRPVGVVAGVIGWNFPLILAAQKIGPVLATGNSLLLKPSELTSFSAARLAELAVEAGVPEGVLNVVHGGGRTGADLASHCDVDLMTFTGSTATGKKLLIAAGQSNMKRLVLECGGKAANIVFEDCPDLEAVADGVVSRAFWNQGQVCTASSRLFVQAGIKRALLPIVIKKAASLRLGDPLMVETRFGALVSHDHRLKVLGFVDRAIKSGASLAYQSDAPPPNQKGYYVSPTILDDVLGDHEIALDEVFGPVLSVMTFEHEDEAIRMANNTRYGLSAVIWTKSLRRAHRLSLKLNVGWISVNATDFPSGGPEEGYLPVGGHKQSGLGVEGGIDGLESYTNQTAVQLFV